MKRPLAQSFFSPLGLLTSLASLPQVVKGVRKIKEGRVTLESFLGGSIILAAAAGEAKATLEILWITSGKELLKQWISERSQRAIRDILQVTEKDTFILTGRVEVSIPVEQVQPGNTVVLHTGEKFAVDGKIIKGEAVVDEAPITGRAEPETRTRGDQVFAGTFVRQGVIYVQAQEVGDRTYLARVMRMVEDSLENKAPIEGIADQLAKNLIKTAFAVTLAPLIITQSFWRAFTVMLVMACPCATILAASTAISAAINTAARRHILIKGDRVMMVGDGINDALALAEADIGVAMGAGGSEVAIEAADIALVEDDLKGVVYVRGLSRKTIKVVHQNFWIATGSNIIGAALGAAGLLSPVLARLVHITHTLGILANSSRLLFYDFPVVANTEAEADLIKKSSPLIGMQ